jgi:hypothetical protein
VTKLARHDFHSLADLLHDLTTLLKRDTEVSRSQRYMHLLLCAAFPLIGLIAMLIPHEPMPMVRYVAMIGMFLSISWALPALIASLLFRGGLIRLLGIETVTNTGAKASRIHVCWRTLVAWWPAGVLALAASGGIPQPFEGPIVLCVSAVFVTGVVWVLVQPQRGLQDIVAGTVLVPR